MFCRVPADKAHTFVYPPSNATITFLGEIGGFRYFDVPEDAPIPVSSVAEFSPVLMTQETAEALRSVAPAYAVPLIQSPEEKSAALIARYEKALDDHLDAVARSYRYDNRFTFALRAAFPGPWHDEGVAFAEWMDSINFQSYQLMIDIRNGVVQMPSLDEFINSLPEFHP